MKKLYTKIQSLLYIIAIFTISCSENVSEQVTYKINEPVFMSAETFRSAVKVTDKSKEISNYGKICFYNGYLYISENSVGIHIIDNRNPSDPKNIGFIELLGNFDLAIRNNLLYADSYIDLVWFDIENPATPTLKGRLENIFPTALPIIENTYGIDYSMTYEKMNDKIVVGWKLKERTENIKSYTGGWYSQWGNNAEMDLLYTSTGPGTNSTGQNGSMSRFTFYDDKLYAVSQNLMTIFDVSQNEPIKLSDTNYIGWDVETIFSYKENMFMGTPTGLIIYSLKDPLKPIFLSRITHAMGCDPVVVENDIAYVTVHSGNNCGQNTNELFLIDVKDAINPKELASFTMTNPKGLGVDNGKLFLCDDGLKVFSITSPEELYLKKLYSVKGMDGYDLIAFNNTLMMIATEGIYQYDYSNLDDIKLLSQIEFQKKP